LIADSADACSGGMGLEPKLGRSLLELLLVLICRLEIVGCDAKLWWGHSNDDGGVDARDGDVEKSNLDDADGAAADRRSSSFVRDETTFKDAGSCDVNILPRCGESGRRADTDLSILIVAFDLATVLLY
jgi:hypothetical protein